MQLCLNAVASYALSANAVGGRGGAKRPSPVGGCAKGTPRYSATATPVAVVRTRPRSVPCSVAVSASGTAVAVASSTAAAHAVMEEAMAVARGLTFTCPQPFGRYKLGFLKIGKTGSSVFENAPENGPKTTKNSRKYCPKLRRSPGGLPAALGALPAALSDRET